MQHRADILSDMVSSVPVLASKSRDWMDRENGPGVALLSQKDLLQFKRISLVPTLGQFCQKKIVFAESRNIGAPGA